MVLLTETLQLTEATMAAWAGAGPREADLDLERREL